MSDPAAQLSAAEFAPSAPEPRPAAVPAAGRLRLWPAVVIVALQWALIKVPGWVAPNNGLLQFMCMFWAPIVTIAALAVWWVFFSRLRWVDRLFGVLAFAAALGGARLLCHPSFHFSLLLSTLPWLATAWAAWLLVTPALRWPVRRAGLFLVFLLVAGYSCLLRFDGVDGSFAGETSWRWSPTAEDRFLAERAGTQPAASPSDGPAPVLQPGDWPGFRGPRRDGRLANVRIDTDWQARPPRELWRRRVGPGWSSFAVIGDRVYTQEQRGADEAVTCYESATGQELWVHTDPDRFTEIVAGPGPRATPTFHAGKLYVQGATGRLSCLDAANGKALWSRDIQADSGAKVPQWGFSASPLVTDGIVTTFGGAEGKSLLGYHAAKGEPAWSAGEGPVSYCSPQPATLAGVSQVLLATDAGLTAFHPTRGEVLWDHSWQLPKEMARIIQPAVLADGDVLVGTGFGNGTRRVRVRRQDAGWTTEEVWTTKAINPYFNDLVVHGDHLYGFDGIFLTCVALADGKGQWRARGYGNGQVLLLSDQGLLLILSERGEVALVEARPESHRELARFKALEGKTWNHPVLAHGRLFVRNGEEMACYKMDQ
jgi:outer membrane protein assembly factor BamB